MATTSSGFQYPASSDPVEVWSDIQALATTLQTWVDTYHASSFPSYAATVTNGGTATFTTAAGHWRYVGPKLVWVNIDIIVNAAGSGASAITIALPSTPDRTYRQILTGHQTGVCSGGSLGLAAGVILASGSGAVIDRVRGQNNGATNNSPNVTGADLLASGEINITGIYRET
jgi:hypothetical protein